jgi:predicted transcriptional regulator YheO
MTREEAFEFLDRTARGIAEMFGSTCETLVHDMGVPTHPILSIYNGHISGRTVGSPWTFWAPTGSWTRRPPPLTR